MNEKDDIKIENYESLIKRGSELVSEIYIIIDKYQPSNKFSLQLDEMSLSLVSVVRKYNEWVENILKFLGSNIEAYFFKEADGIPKRFDRNLRILLSFNILSETSAFSIKLLDETKKKLERLIGLTRLEQGQSQKEIRRKNKFTLKNGEEIKDIELEIDKTENKRIKAYINTSYNNPFYFNRRKYWKKMYELARDKQTSYDKGFSSYFNSNQINPLYSRYGFKLTKILKQDGLFIEPNIKISLIHPKKVSQQLNSA